MEFELPSPNFLLARRGHQGGEAIFVYRYTITIESDQTAAGTPDIDSPSRARDSRLSVKVVVSARPFTTHSRSLTAGRLRISRICRVIGNSSIQRRR
jgi:hypothetical protein